jgi:tetratricopeptide (TPR) repeat protein
MRKIVFILMCSLVFAACSSEHCRNTSLLQAEAICQQYPDSTIRLLDGLDIDSFSVEADRALYGLVFTEAIHHVGLILSSDTLINLSQQFYEQQGDDVRLARACLHHGIVLYGQKRYGEAFRLLKRAEELAEDVNDLALNYELFAVMGDINDNANNYPLTLDYYHRSLRAAEQLGNQEWTVRQLNNLATTFDGMNNTDSLKAYIERCRPLQDSVQGPIRATMLTNMGSYYLHQNDLDKAKEYLLLSQQTTYLDKTIKLLGDIAALEGKWPQACDYWFQTLQSGDYAIRIDAYRKLINYYDSLAEYDEKHHRMASHLSQRLNTLYRDNYENNGATSILDMQAQYDEQQKERHQYRTMIGLLTALGIVILIAGLIAWYYILTHRELVQMQRQKKRQIRDNSRQLKDVTARLHKTVNLGKVSNDEDISTLAQCCYSLNPTLLALLKMLRNQ